MRKIDPRIILIIFLIGIALVVFAPLLFTRNWTNFSFIDTGQIGDTIGGITAPITSLIGSFLLYFTLKAQIDANEQINQQISEQKTSELYSKKLIYINEQINLIREEINEFQEIERKNATINKRSPFNLGSTNVEHLNIKGPDALDYYLKRYCIKGGHDYFQELHISAKIVNVYNLLKLIEETANLIFNEGLDKTDKIRLTNSLSYHFFSKIYPIINSKKDFSIEESQKCDTCNKKHLGIPTNIFTITYNTRKILISDIN